MWYFHKQEVVNLHSLLLESLIEYIHGFPLHPCWILTSDMFFQHLNFCTCLMNVWWRAMKFFKTKTELQHAEDMLFWGKISAWKMWGWLKGYAIPVVPNLLTSDLLGATGILQRPWEFTWLHSKSPLQPGLSSLAVFCYSWCDVWNTNSLLTAVNGVTVLFVIM
jgi:hypothetical protein